jgi:GT2 family glycosyltransferase
MAPSEGIVVSVILATRNTCGLTRAAIRSVLQSQDTLTKEIVVVDNGSTDETPVVVPREFPAVKYLRSETNLGFAKANNLGTSGAKGEFLLLLNSDARLKVDTLAQGVSWMRQHPECGIAGVQLVNPDGSLQNSIANAPSLATELLNKSLLRRLFPRRFPGKERVGAAPREVESVVGACMLIRRILWQAIGGFDERFFFFLEETDFCLQARRRGWKVFHLPQVQAWHEQGKSAKQLGTAARIEYWRSRYAYFEKNCSRVTCVLLRAGLRVRLLANWLASSLLFCCTFGCSPRWRDKYEVNTTLWRWHLRGCPPQMGLPR